MRMLLAALVLLTASQAFAQGARFPAHFSANPTDQPAPQESITISDPNGSTVTTTATAIVVSGSVSSGLVFKPVTWANSLTSGSGTAVLDAGTRQYTTVVTASAVRFRDDVIRTTSTDVTLSAPDTGTWSALRTDGGNFCRSMSSDYIQPNASAAAPNIVACEMIGTSSITGGNYDVYHTLAAGAWSPGSTGNSVILFDIVDVTDGTKDYCSLELLSSTANPDARLTKTVNDVSTALATANIAPINGQVWHLKVRGNVIEAYQDDVLRLTATDADCHRAASARTALAFGATYVGGTRTINTGARVSYLRVEDADAGTTGIPLNVGDNVITVTGKDPNDTPYTATVHVIRTGSDTTPPNLSTTSPSGNTDYSTTDTVIAFAGLVSDPGGGVSSVVVSCPTGTPTTPAVSVVDGVWTAAAVTFVAGGTRTCTITATDTAALTTVLTRNIIIAASSDSTNPTISITSPNGTGSSMTTSSSVSFIGTASDNVALRTANPVTYVGSSGCPTGNVPGSGGGTSLSWALNATIASSCTITFTVTDAAGNTATAQHALTYNQPLSWLTSATLPIATKSVAYSTLVRLQGGTAPFTIDNGAGGTSLGCAGTLGAAGALTDNGDGTATLAGTFPTAGTCLFNVRGQDSAAGSTTRQFSLTVGNDVLGSQNDIYFNTLCGRADLFAGHCYSLRDEPNQLSKWADTTTTCPTGGHEKIWSYSPSTDTDANKQDAAKMVLCAFAPEGRPLGADVATATAGDYTLISVSTSALGAGRVLLLESELVAIANPDGSSNPIVDATHAWVVRGMYGTTVAAHTAGTTVYFNQDKIGTTHELYMPFGNDPTEAATYLMTWDWHPSTGWAGLGAAGDCAGVPVGIATPYDSKICTVPDQGYKAFQNRAPGITHEFHLYTQLAVGDATTPPGYNVNTDVGAFNARIYAPIDPHSGFTNEEPMAPMTDKIRVLPNTTYRIWAIIEWNPDTNSSAWTNYSTTTAALGNDPVLDTTMSIDATGFPTAYNWIWDGTNNTKGRRLKIDSEVVSIVSCVTSGNPRTCTVVRAVDGTSIATHSSGATVQAIWSCISYMIASPTQSMVHLLDNVRWAPYRKSATLNDLNPIDKWNIEMDASATRYLKSRSTLYPNNVVSYVENFAALKISGTNGATCTTGAIPAAWASIVGTQPVP